MCANLALLKFVFLQSNDYYQHLYISDIFFLFLLFNHKISLLKDWEFYEWDYFLYFQTKAKFQSTMKNNDKIVFRGLICLKKLQTQSCPSLAVKATEPPSHS